MTEWIDTIIGEQATLQRGIDITKSEQRAGSVPVISSGGVSSYHDAAAVSGPGVVLGRKGVVGSVYFVRTDYWPHDTTLWVKDFHGNEPRFVYYFFQWIARRLAAMDVGSANPTLNRNHVHPIKIRWPTSKIEQQAVAALLGALDDKIDLNRRMNETLEAMARAIFKDWFVDFGPTRAKFEGRAPYLAPGIWGLFPDALDSHSKPVSWRLSRLGDFFRLERGLSYKGEFLTKFGTPMINLGCFQGGGRFEAQKIKPYSGEIRARHRVRPGDLILANTDMTQKRIVLGSPHIVSSIDGDELIFSHHVYAARALSVNAEQWKRFFYFHLLQSEFRERAEGFATGTTVLFLPSDAAEKCTFALPSEKLNAAFLETIEPMFQRVDANNREVRTLSATRDLLLPKLMSGEIRVSEADKELERVA